MRRRWILLPLILLLLTAAHCGGRANNAGPTTSSEEQVRVTVRNDGFYDATVYLLRGAERRRLGTVNGASTQTFVLARHLVFGLTDLRFGVDWIGRRGGAASETIVAQPGDEIQLIIR
jgi:hypothetical protein